MMVCFKHWGAVGVMLLALACGGGEGGLVQAQALRDPTEPPASAGLPGQTVTPVPGPLGGQPTAILVRNGKPYLVVGTRLYAQGQQIGQARVERITETEVWLREGTVLHKLPQFAGIQRRAAVPATAPCAEAAPTVRQDKQRHALRDSRPATVPPSSGPAQPSSAIASSASPACPGAPL